MADINFKYKFGEQIEIPTHPLQIRFGPPSRTCRLKRPSSPRIKGRVYVDYDLYSELCQSKY